MPQRVVSNSTVASVLNDPALSTQLYFLFLSPDQIFMICLEYHVREPNEVPAAIGNYPERFLSSEFLTIIYTHY